MTVASLHDDRVWQRLSTHRLGGVGCRHGFGPVIVSEDNRDDASTNDPGVDQETSRPGNFGPDVLGHCLASWRCDRKWHCGVWRCGQSPVERPVWILTSALRAWSCHLMSSIWRWHFIWKLNEDLLSVGVIRVWRNGPSRLRDDDDDDRSPP